MNSVTDPLVGHVLSGRYEILTKLARGGMATVYRARDQKLSRTVAVKVMRTDLGEDPEFVAKFDREARLAATLSHPNLVSVFDQGTEGGQSYIVMEFVEGRTLRSTVTRECPIPPANMLEIAESVSSALAVAHDAGLVHRDIKPENVLISKRGEIKVTDFGLARQVTGPNMTATGVLVGTASYISPELVTKSRPDARSDVYSTGVMLYELLTGTKPHTGETNYQIAYAHVNSDIPAPSQAIKNLGLNLDWQIPDYVDALVQACTSRDPNLRPKDGRRLLGLVRQCRKALAAGVTSDPDLAAAVQSDALNTQAITPMSPSQLSSNMKPAPEQVSKVWRPLESNKVTPLSPASPSLGQQNKIFPDQDQNVLAAASVTAAATTNGVTTSVNTGKENGYPDVNSQRTPTFPISQHPVHRRRRGVALLAVIIIIALLAGLGSWWFMTGRYTTVPELASLTQDEAKNKAEAQGLELDFEKEYSENIAALLITRSDPESGTRIVRGSVVKVWISQGPERVNMPPVIGLEVKDAQAAVEKARLSIGKVTKEYSDEVEAGRIISASQEKDAQLKVNTPIDLVVSKGPKPIAIKNYVGKNGKTATAELEKAGFTVETSSEHNKEIPAGNVVSQTPSEGEGKKGDQVSLVISKGPVLVQIPNVRYDSRRKAVAKLQKAGFKVKIEEADKIFLLNIAAGSKPEAGTMAPEGSTVVLYVK